jgi:hypothetical protein
VQLDAPATFIGDAPMHIGAADENLMPETGEVLGLTLQDDWDAVAPAVHGAEHQDAELAGRQPQVPPPRLLSARREGDVVSALVAEIRTVVGIVLKQGAMPRARIAPLLEEQLVFGLGDVEAAALRLEVHVQRLRHIDITVAAF